MLACLHLELMYVAATSIERMNLALTFFTSTNGSNFYVFV
jgi:hypothetical protein